MRRPSGLLSFQPGLALRLAGCIVAAAALCSAQPRIDLYCVTWAVTLAGSGGAITIQQPATGARNVRGVSATIHSSAECAFEIERNGTAATETAATAWTARDATPATPAAKAWTESDVGAGDVGPRHVVPAGGTFPLALHDLELRGNGTAKNFTLRPDACTADVVYNVCWQEF